MEPTRVAVVDERYVFRRGVVVCLADDATLTVIHEAGWGAVDDTVDVVVASGKAAATTVWKPPVVVCAQHAGSFLPAPGNRVMAVLEVGRLGMEELQGAVRAAGAGLEVRSGVRSANDIDARMLAVLGLLAAGAQTRDISHELGFSERTIKKDIQDVTERLEARTRTQAVALAIRQGLI